MLESKVQKKIIDYLEGRKWVVIKIVSANAAGLPDLICCSPKGLFVAIEVKTENGKLSALQEYKLESIRQCGGLAFVAYGWEHFLQIYKESLQ